MVQNIFVIDIGEFGKRSVGLAPIIWVDVIFKEIGSQEKLVSKMVMMAFWFNLRSLEQWIVASNPYRTVDFFLIMCEYYMKLLTWKIFFYFKFIVTLNLVS